ncbi:hypothetical protein [Kitasatospora sp. NPDC091207]|uniref:hypothetical protein n=1 Tax=Kitasatospora sp. NPDC091207 TaxID=3364083 RepID=UPI00381910BE
MATPVRTERPRTVAPARPGGPAAARRAGPLGRLRQAGRTAPGRLRLAGALLTVLTVAFGALTAWQVNSRAQAAERVVSYSQPLSQAAADIHRSLADADTTAATGFLLAGAEPKAVRDRYEQDLATASRLIAEAAARTTASSPAQGWLAALNQQIPVYAGLVEGARADNRQGFPLGGAYLRYASDQMRTVLLPAAAALSAAENQALADDYAEARAVPWAAYGLGVLALAALAWVQVTLYRRTNRVFNIGLVGATAAVLSAVLWLTVTGTGANSALHDSERKGAGPLRALNAARVDVLTARLAENLHFVARGSSTQYADLWSKTTEHLSASNPPANRYAGTLPEALRLAPADAGAAIDEAQRQYQQWRERHLAASTLENVDADYQGALDATVTVKEADVPKSADAAFNAVDQGLARAAETELQQFRRAAEGTDGDLRTAAAAVALLALVAAASAVRGLGRRLAEYR